MRKKRRRFKDKTHHKATLISKRSDESWQQRHKRRKAFAIQSRDTLQAFCILYGIWFRVTNKDHHWQFKYGGNLCEWWPATAKFVVNKKWRDGHHVHDYATAISLIEKFLFPDGLENYRSVIDDDGETEEPAAPLFEERKKVLIQA